jgi:hypothetical protein
MADAARPKWRRVMNDAEVVVPALAHIAAEHRDLDRRIKRLWHHVRQPIDENLLPAALAELVLHLQELHDVMNHHFEAEAAGGYLEEAVARVPRLARAADAIEGHHPELLRDVSKLVESAKNAKPSIETWEQMRVVFARFAGKLLAHETVENRILQQGFNGDPALFDLDKDR